MSDKLILYFDVYIVSNLDTFQASLKHKYSRASVELSTRSCDNAYRYQAKLDICKYVIASYATLQWDEIFIRYECENIFDTDDFYQYCRELLPNASIENKRSDSGKKYFDSLIRLRKFGNPWIFFCPNNDHPFIGNDLNLKKYLDLAEGVEKNYPGTTISVLYSHFTESINNVSWKKRLWGEYELIFPKILYENNDAYVNIMNKFYSDSIQIFRLETLLHIFSETKNLGRVVRIEDTEFYLNRLIKHILVVPKIELCRHYDGYFHRKSLGGVMRAPAPLFIPEGFFSKEIKIAYGFKSPLPGYTNINPLSRYCSYTGLFNTPDMNCLLCDIPLFWNPRIVDVKIADGFNDSPLSKKELPYYIYLSNPWFDDSWVANVVNSLSKWTLIAIKILLIPYFKFREIIYALFGRFYWYKALRALKNGSSTKG